WSDTWARPRHTGRRGAQSGVRLRGDGLPAANNKLIFAAVVVDDAALSDEALQLGDHPRPRPDHALLVSQSSAEIRSAERAVSLVGPDLKLGLQASSGLLRALDADRLGTESEIPTWGELDWVIQAGIRQVRVRVRSVVDHGRRPIVVDSAGGHGALLVLVFVGGDAVWLGLGPGAAEIVRVGLTKRRAGDGVEFDVLVGQALGCGRQEAVLIRGLHAGRPIHLHGEGVALRWGGLHGSVGRTRPRFAPVVRGSESNQHIIRQ